MSLGNANKTPANITIGTKFRGEYMWAGATFTGTVTSIESNQSGYGIDSNHVMVSVKVDADIVAPARIYKGMAYPEQRYREAGEEIVIHCEQKNGRLVREDSKYVSLFVVR